MQKYTYHFLKPHDGDYMKPECEDGAEFYLASDVDARIAELRGALADIAASKDMTLEVARAKAKRIYDSTAN